MTVTFSEPDQSPGPVRPQSRPAQESALARIAGWCHDHRWLVLVIWLGALVASNVLAQAAGSSFTNNLTGGTQEVQQILNADFPGQAGSPAQVVITTTSPFTDPSNQAGKRLAPLLATVVPLCRRDGDITMTDVGAALLVSMSAATIDRHLAPEQAKVSPRGRSHTKPGTLH